MIITWDELKEMNDLLKENNLMFKVHLTDACGGQTMWIETLPGGDVKDIKKINPVLIEYFKQQNAEIEFNDKNDKFWVKGVTRIF
jgi:hypothetical protein